MNIRQRSWTHLSARSARSARSAHSVPTAGKPWWKRALQGCIASSNPDYEEEGEATSTLVSVSNKPRRAAYIPKYAKSSFVASATPIKYEDSDRKKDVADIYRAGSTIERVEGGGLRIRGKNIKMKKKKRKAPQASSKQLSKALHGKS